MTEAEFNPIMDKLRVTYGEKYYLDLRTEFIWQIVSDFKAQWFDSLINLWIGSNTKPILVNEIRDAAIKEKTKQLQATTLATPKAMPGSIFEDSDIKMMFNMIKKKNACKVSDEEWKSFTEWVEEAVKLSKQRTSVKCNVCFDEGYLWREKDENYVYSYRCECILGMSKESYLPVWRENG